LSPPPLSPDHSMISKNADHDLVSNADFQDNADDTLNP